MHAELLTVILDFSTAVSNRSVSNMKMGIFIISIISEQILFIKI